MRDKETGRICVVLERAGGSLWSDYRYVVLGTETAGPDMRKMKGYTCHPRLLSQLEPIDLKEVAHGSRPR